jgi:hypothetical protein
MQFSPETPRQNITIQGAQFTIPTPFTEGHVLTAGEASQMNQLLTENVRNNLSGKAKARAEKNEAALTQDEVDAYVSEYEFGERKAGSGEARLSPEEREARRIARERISAALKQKGVKVDKDNMEKMVTTLAAREDIIKEARKRVQATSKISIEELDLDTLVQKEAA